MRHTNCIDFTWIFRICIKSPCFCKTQYFHIVAITSDVKSDRLLGSKCRAPEAGIEVHIEGESNEEARNWASDPVRRRTLHTLATTYVGAHTPAVRFVLWLDPDNVPEGRLDGTTTLGGMAVLGGATSRIALPIEIGAG